MIYGFQIKGKRGIVDTVTYTYIYYRAIPTYEKESVFLKNLYIFVRRRNFSLLTKFIIRPKTKL